MVKRGWMPDVVLCSTAARAQQTWHETGNCGPKTLMIEELYSRDAAGYLEIIRQSGVETSLMLVGHNPMIEEVALALAGKDDPAAEEIRRLGYPTAGLAAIDIEGSFADMEPGRGRFIGFLTPGSR